MHSAQEPARHDHDGPHHLVPPRSRSPPEVRGPASAAGVTSRPGRAHAGCASNIVSNETRRMAWTMPKDLSRPRTQYSPLITKYDPRIVPASFDFCRANLKELSSAGTSIPSESLNPTARFFGSSRVYRTLIESPLS